MITGLKRDKPHWGARKLRELLPNDVKLRSIATGWCITRAARAAAPRAPRPPAAHPTTSGAPTSRANSGSATAGIAIHSPSPTRPLAFCDELSGEGANISGCSNSNIALPAAPTARISPARWLQCGCNTARPGVKITHGLYKHLK